LLSTFVLLSPAAIAEPLQLRFAYQNISNYPFQTGDGEHIDWSKPGMAVEMLRQLDDNLAEVEIEFVRLPWKRGLLQLQRNQVQGLFNASYKSERLEYGVYPSLAGRADESRRSYSNSYHLYVHRSSDYRWDPENIDKQGLGIAAPLGFSIVDDLRAQDGKILEFASLQRCLTLLLQQRVDAVASLGAAADAIIAQDIDYQRSIVRLDPPLKSKNYYLMLSKQFVSQHPELADRIWNQIRKVRDSKAFDKVILKYAD